MTTTPAPTPTTPPLSASCASLGITLNWLHWLSRAGQPIPSSSYAGQVQEAVQQIILADPGRSTASIEMALRLQTARAAQAGTPLGQSDLAALPGVVQAYRDAGTWDHDWLYAALDSLAGFERGLYRLAPVEAS